MKSLLVAAALCLLPVSLGAQGLGRPILDMHLHAWGADANGPPGAALCVPITSHMPPHDSSRPWGEVMAEMSSNPPCADPVWAPLTDSAVVHETLQILEEWNVIGVLSGNPTRVAGWRSLAPDRFIPGLEFQLGREDLSPVSASP